MPSDTMDFFEEQGVPLKIERGNRVFPESDRAVDIVDALCRYAKHPNVTLLQGRVAELLVEEERLCGVKTEDGKRYDAPKVLLATGGLSYPATGSTGDGYALARSAGHTIIEPQPPLCRWRHMRLGQRAARACAEKYCDHGAGCGFLPHGVYRFW